MFARLGYASIVFFINKWDFVKAVFKKKKN